MNKYINEEVAVIAKIIKDDGTFVNNGKLPVLLYKKVIGLIRKDAAKEIEEIFALHNWSNFWRNGIYDYHHYHSTTHEVLGVYAGKAKVQLGGPEGVIMDLEKGDVIIIPAGVAHKNLGSSTHFACVGAYPEGREYDINYGNPEERENAKNNITNVPIPSEDPVYGKRGNLFDYWK